MPDHDIMAKRRGVLDGETGSVGSFSAEGLTLHTAGPAIRFSLRMDAALASAASQPAAFDLAQPINTLRETQGDDGVRLSARIGPDEWLLIADEPARTGGDIAAKLASDLGAAAYTLVDISHRNIAIELGGDAAADVLNTGCPLDLGNAVFPAGTVTRTLFAKTEIVLARRTDAQQRPLYRIECWRSFGRYLHAHLCDSARLIGVGGPAA